MNNSKKIIFNYENIDLNKKILKDYFDNTYKNYIKEKKYYINQKLYDKIKIISNFINDKNLYNDIKKKTIKLYKNFFYPLLENELKNEFDELFYNNFNINFEDLFYIHRKIYKLKETQINALINYQYIYIKNFNYYKNIKLNNIEKEIHSNLTKIKNEQTNKFDDFVSNYISKFIIIEKLNSKKKKYIKELDEKEKKIFNFLKNICNNFIVTDIRKNDKKIYGSYSCFVINNDVVYNDIDLYHKNPLEFLSFLMTLIYIFFNIKTELKHIPMIPGHTSLCYNTNHFIDCLYLNDFVFNKINTIDIDDCFFVNPEIQLLNNFRMIANIARMDKINKETEKNNKLKLETFLFYINKNNKINFKDNDSLFEIKTYFINNFVIIDLEKINNFMNLNDFDYLIIPLTDPKTLFEFLKNINNIRISNQFFSLFGETCIECFNKINDKISDKMLNDDLESYIEIFSLKDLSKIKIQESDIKKHKTKIEKNINILDFINKNNTLIMSSFSIDIYIKNYYNNFGILKKQQICNLSIETLLSSFFLYNYLKKKITKDKIGKMFTLLLNFINNNKVNNELKLLSYNKQIKINKNNIYCIISCFEKYKIKGDHIIFGYYNFSYKGILFYKNQNKDYYNLEDFLSLTYYNN